MEEHIVRKTVITLAVVTGFLSLGTIGASAVTLGPMNGSDQVSTAASSVIQKADWCGSRCEYQRHRNWEQHRRWEEGQRWRDYPRGHYYGYSDGSHDYR
jgi:hypothetical protein